MSIDDLYVLYKYSDDFHKRGYDKLINKKYRRINWISESNLKEDFLDIVNAFSGDFYLSFADDDCLVKPINLDLLLPFLDNDKIQSASIKFSDQIRYNSVDQKPMSRPDFIQKDSFLLWNWSEQDSDQDWGYPMALTGTVFRMRDVEKHFVNLQYINLTRLEGEMNHHRDANKPLMVSFNETKLATLPLNSVSNVTRVNPHGDVSIEMLNDKYLAGYGIDLNKIVLLQPKLSFFLYNINLEFILI